MDSNPPNRLGSPTRGTAFGKLKIRVFVLRVAVTPSTKPLEFMQNVNSRVRQFLAIRFPSNEIQMIWKPSNHTRQIANNYRRTAGLNQKFTRAWCHRKNDHSNSETKPINWAWPHSENESESSGAIERLCDGGEGVNHRPRYSHKNTVTRKYKRHEVNVKMFLKYLDHGSIR